MSTVYADRGFISINGVEALDVQSITMRQTEGARYVPVMSRNKRHRGTVSGNRDITVNFAIAVQKRLGTPKIEFIDYENNDVALTFEHGSDRYTVVGLAWVDSEQSAGGVGTEGRKTWTLIGTDVIDQVGNSVLFPLDI
jgi:hypothetical protein